MIEEIFPIIISVLGIILFGFVIYIFYYLRSAEKKEEERYIFLKVSKELEEKLNELMEEEMKKVVFDLNQKIIASVGETIEFYKKEISSFSKRIIEEFSQFSNFNREIQEKILKEVEREIVELEKENKKGISEIGKTYLSLQELIIKEAKDKMAELTKNIAGKIEELYPPTSKILNQKMAEAEQDIENYKKERVKELDSKIYQIISQVAKKTIGKAIDLSTHEELVMAALEKAKKEKNL